MPVFILIHGEQKKSHLWTEILFSSWCKSIFNIRGCSELWQDFENSGSLLSIEMKPYQVSTVWGEYSFKYCLSTSAWNFGQHECNLHHTFTSKEKQRLQKWDAIKTWVKNSEGLSYQCRQMGSMGCKKSRPLHFYNLFYLCDVMG